MTTPHSDPYQRYFSNPALREWVKWRIADTGGVSTEREWVEAAIKKWGSMEAAREAINLPELDPDFRKRLEQTTPLGAKPTKDTSVKYFKFGSNIGIRVWLPESMRNTGNCCFDFVDDEHREIPKPVDMMVHTLSGPFAGSELFSIGEHLMKAWPETVMHPLGRTYVVLSGGTIRFRKKTVTQPLRDILVRLPLDVTNDEPDRPAPLVLQ